MQASPKNLPLLAELLADQQLLETPAARFAQAHARSATPAQAPRYRDLIPLTKPKAGEQYAFEVELDSCTGCKACVAACHSLNGLDDTETWRDVGLQVGGDHRHPFQQTVTTACHHCADPACLNGCPVLAYEKDPVTGIVRHLGDQCIGCQYCVMQCPYDVPKFNARLGIVRKCDMCHGRLAAGEAPACVQACPTQAIRIVTVITHIPAVGPTGRRIPLNSFTADFLPAAPDPARTLPTTRYLTNRVRPANLHAADASAPRIQSAHWPLVMLLVFLPLAVGCLAFAVFSSDRIAAQLTRLAWVAGAIGLAASGLHLGQPLRAWRVFLGWRRSWLSREAMVLGGWFGLATLALALPALVPLAALVGGAGLGCSVMVYVNTRRSFWRLAQTGPRFFGSAVILGAAALLTLGGPSSAAAVLLVATLLKLAVELRPLREGTAPVTASARLLSGPLRPLLALRLVCALTSGVLLPVLLVARVVPPAAAWVAFGFALAGELAERTLFFRAVDAPKMPGPSA